MRKLILALPFVLAACAGTPETRATNALGIACDAYATALVQLAANKDKLSDSQVSKVDGMNKITDPLCSPGSDVDPAEAVKTVRSAVAKLNEIKVAF